MLHAKESDFQIGDVVEIRTHKNWQDPEHASETGVIDGPAARYGRFLRAWPVLIDTPGLRRWHRSMVPEQLLRKVAPTRPERWVHGVRLAVVDGQRIDE